MFTAELSHFVNGTVKGGLAGGLDDDLDEVAGLSSSSARPRDEVIRRMIGECVRNETVTRCAVLVPQLPIPSDTKVWCMYHCQYSCECGGFKNPLDYGPDLTASRNVSRRTVGPLFKTKRRRSSAAAESPTPSKEDPDWEGEGPTPPKRVAPIKISLKSKSSPQITSKPVRTHSLITNNSPTSQPLIQASFLHIFSKRIEKKLKTRTSKLS